MTTNDNDGGGPVAQTPSTSDPSRDVVRAGVDSARQIVEQTTSMMDEIFVGFESIARHSSKLASATYDSARDLTRSALPSRVNVAATNRGSNSSGAKEAVGSAGAGNASKNEQDDLVGQVLDLARDLVKVAGDAAGRLLEIGVGPIERLTDADSHRRDVPRVVLGPVRAGRQARATFELENSDDHESSVSLVLTNALASMNGTIPIDRVTFDPDPAAVDAGRSCPVTVTVRVPESAPSGRYLGIVRSDQVPDLILIMEVDVS
jgi:hypothetical protein